MSKEKIEQTKKAAMVFFFAVAAFLSAWLCPQRLEESGIGRH